MYRAVRIPKFMTALASAIVALVSAPAFAGTVWFDTTAAMRSAGGYPITNRTDVDWAYANRSAEGVCAYYGYARGMYNGEQSGELMGIHCFSSDMITWQDIPGSDARAWALWQGSSTSLSSQAAFNAGAIADNECGSYYNTGYFTGFQNMSTDLFGLVCVQSPFVGIRGVNTNDSRFPFLNGMNPPFASWWQLRSAVTRVCQNFGYSTGTMDTYSNTGTPFVLNLALKCIY
ncbi:hypothetical protein COCOR_03443 [Corallococcus coralloides DSM 2259]|uniref:Lipoprotein n=1 Tax=Corallococcus coralloides (strain ATCC 25202 / DSM 2259 / NBRC 100086 / M2) TaxID=1144275 RepID=H8MKH9_CORCM|nr:hypothetical protein [Corallococcus coralloides]AFE05239.1 hypothetical protein COCOR_03443 [Corallococcus coralloides DSM 2259]